MKTRLPAIPLVLLLCLSGCQTDSRTEPQGAVVAGEAARAPARPVYPPMKPCDGGELKRYVDTISRRVLQLWSADDEVGFGSKVRAHFRVDRRGTPYGLEVDEASSPGVELAFRAALAGASLPVPPRTRSCAAADQPIGLTLTMKPAP